MNLMLHLPPSTQLLFSGYYGLTGVFRSFFTFVHTPSYTTTFIFSTPRRSSTLPQYPLPQSESLFPPIIPSSMDTIIDPRPLNTCVDDLSKQHTFTVFQCHNCTTYSRVDSVFSGYLDYIENAVCPLCIHVIRPDCNRYTYQLNTAFWECEDPFYACEGRAHWEVLYSPRVWVR